MLGRWQAVLEGMNAEVVARCARELSERAPAGVEFEGLQALWEYARPPRFDVWWVPEQVRALGEMHASVHDGEFLEFDTKHLDQVTALITRAGFRVIEDDATIRRAEGY